MTIKRAVQESDPDNERYIPLEEADVEAFLRTLSELKARVFHIYDLLNARGPYEEPRELRFGEDPPTGEWTVVWEGSKEFIPTAYLSMTDAQILKAEAKKSHQRRLRQFDQRITMTKDAIARAEETIKTRDNLNVSLTQLKMERELEVKRGPL